MKGRAKTLSVVLAAAIGMAFLSAVRVQAAAAEKAALVVVGHGTAPKDFPREKLSESRRVHGQVMQVGGKEKAPAELVARLEALEREVRQWKRTPENDPYDATVRDLAARMQKIGGFEIVEVTHNEACGQDVDEGIESAIKRGATRVYVLTVMVTRGGSHAERDIPEKLEKARRAHPNVPIIYVWPPDSDQLAHFFVAQLNRFKSSAQR
ncbi:MAG: hypothetical protein FJ279_06540 [Planctomycetes bacterium]|nr:hypothetical protein [Planctomycetota bacterium]MBM4078540.1 hypothetical protein [Planctomycetota bacterium]